MGDFPGRILDHGRTAARASALEIDGECWSYGALLAAVGRIAPALPEPQAGAAQPVTAVMVHRHASAYIGLLAAHLRGHAFVPINVGHPASRSARVLQMSGAKQVICGALARDRLDSILAVAPEVAQRLEIVECGERLVDFPDTALPGDLGGPAPDALAYIMFTSGSTGEPKGVPVGQDNLSAYLHAVDQVFPAVPGDRFSQTFDLNFDLGMHDIFVALTRGATLVVPSHAEMGDIAAWTRKKRITNWFSVPTLGYQVRLQNELSAGAFPDLRSVLFCGEVLSAQLARDWQAAAPNAIVENWYGPTEATIACARHVLSAQDAGGGADAVPIGRPFPGMTMHVLDAAGAPCAAGTVGSLYLSGPQLARGYLDDPDRTRKSFVSLPDGTRAYRTGDRAVLDKTGITHFLGREDSQIKLRGYRIELGEVEGALRDASGGGNVVVLPWPPDAAAVGSLIGVVEGEGADAGIRQALQRNLPDYMVPAEILSLPRFPRNASGKVDRRALAEDVAAHLQADRVALPSDDLERALLEAVLTAAPAISRHRVLSGSSLLAIGMDSLAFIQLTMLLEDRFGLMLDQAEVVRFSEMSFGAMAREIRARRDQPTRTRKRTGALRRLLRAIKVPRRKLNVRLLRTLQFVDRFPRALDDASAPLVIAVGSSGVFRAFSPEVVERELGDRVSAINAGLPAVSPDGLVTICAFIRDECRKRGLRIRTCLWELDPMHISTSPPAGDVDVTQRHIARGLRGVRLPETASEFDWSLDERGAWLADPDRPIQRRHPDWARARDMVIAQTYRGALEIDPTRLAAWKEGARLLSQVSDEMVCFVHPADPDMLAEVPQAVGEDRLATLLDAVARDTGLRVLPWQGFMLQSDDFMDINHVNAVRGRAALSAQLARML